MTLAAAFQLVAFAAITPTASPVPPCRVTPTTTRVRSPSATLVTSGTASEDGTRTRRLTDHRAREVYPRFSPDGRLIAFSSNRYGNDEVFVVPATGGTPKRLTFHTDAGLSW